WLLYLTLSLTFCSDFLIATSMCVLLAKQRYGVFKQMDHTVRILIMYSINTGALTTLCTLICLITYAVSPHTFIYIVFYFLLPKLLLNSVLATFNARKTL
ncbi:hypothetical protein GY45DRAFT_1216099, partial [Cubamyces sp. BRFM 1775]